jgi:hypothetical protein
MTQAEHQLPINTETDHTASQVYAGRYAIGETVTLDPGDTYSVPNVPTSILTTEEVQNWASEQGFGNGKRGTYHNESSFLYIKSCHSLKRVEDVAPALEAVSHMTASGILHPATQWGVFERGPSDYQLFAVSPKLQSWSQNGFSASETRQLKKPYPARLEWIRRLDPAADVITVTPVIDRKDEFSDFDDWGDSDGHVPMPYDKIQSKNPLADTINLYEASHADNWGRDNKGRLYPIDVEVIRINGTREMDAIREWQASRQIKELATNT